MIQLKITEDIRYIGVNDHDIDLFEGQYVVENGMAYNSYVVLDEKIAVFDTVDARFGDEWLGKLADTIGARRPDYLIVQHMEPDHSANIARFMEAYPETQVVASAKAFAMMKQFFGVEEDWTCEARRYYIGIVGKYGAQVQALLKKAAALDIQMICPLHGPVLRENLGYYIGKYDAWSSYTAEDEGVLIAFTSVYGHTRAAVELLAEKLREKGCPKVTVADPARCDMAEAVEDAFRYSKLVLATTTYNAGIFPFMHTFIDHLTERNFQNRTVGLLENGSWAPTAAKTMKKLLEGSKNLAFMETTVTVKSALSDESRAQIEALAAELC